MERQLYYEGKKMSVERGWREGNVRCERDGESVPISGRAYQRASGAGSEGILSGRPSASKQGRTPKRGRGERPPPQVNEIECHKRSSLGEASGESRIRPFSARIKRVKIILRSAKRATHCSALPSSSFISELAKLSG